ncbi:MAG TPA: alternative ribosome rescue aminoacyl-tRNA hydrolase ArfB [Gaiellaceae bacterium]|nr:alternative ribosome rescue aminoacyl-tRNA hydrolase ArfB [Gaiellaceae bacterium]
MSSRIAAMRPESIRVHRGLAIPLAEIRVRTSRSSGPGGQHAQKTETRVEATFDVDTSATLSDGQKARIRARAGPVVRAVAQDERSQARNRELALERLATALREALRRDRPRRPTTPTRAARERRLEQKRARSRTKRLRRPPADES